MSRAFGRDFGPGESTAAPSVEPVDAGRCPIIGASPAFEAMMDQVRRVARTEASVLIEGETGSGKELVARAIHYGGTREAGPFVPLNCGGFPDHLVESELFGHERGAFTDAKTARRGIVAEANGGTLFLDEVDALSAKAQVTLLRFLQDQHYRPLGGTRELGSNVRLIAATNQPLRDAAEQGRFRPDLLYRLKILHLQLPPLRTRAGDAERLARHFVGLFSAKYRLALKAFDDPTLAWIRSYPWPGNVRELENWVHRELLMADGPIIHAAPAQHADAACADAARPRLAEPCSFQRAKAEAMRLFEHDYVLNVLRQTQGNVTRAAQIAGTERRAFGKLLKKHRIDRLSVSD